MTLADASTNRKVSRDSSAAERQTVVALFRSMTSTGRPLAALYRGLTPNLIGNATSWASFFFFKARADELLSRWRGSGSGSGAVPGSPAPPSSKPTAIDYLLAPALAGAATTVLTNPIWVIKTRMLSSDRGAAGAYPSMTAGALTILRTEGLAGFYRGLGVSLVGVSHGAVQFAVYEPAKRAYRSRRNADFDEPLSSSATMMLSSSAKLVAGAVTYPYQVLRSRLQNYQAEERFGRGFSGVVRKTWAEEGVKGFYRGLVPGVIRVMPATWVTFLVYENVKYYIPQWTG